MNPAEIKKRVAEVLGVSNSQKDLAFEVLTDSIAEILTEGVTLKIPQIGFFQLKPASYTSSSIKQLMYSVLPEDYDRTEKNLYHTFDIVPKYRNPFEIDSQAFSIGVGKPILPLADEESSYDHETSFAMLKKSIEERVRELISESDQIPNFNIWDDVFENEAEFGSEESSNIFESTKDEFKLEIPKSNKPEIEIQNQNFLNSLLSTQKPEASEEFFAEEKCEEPKELGLTLENSFIEQEEADKSDTAFIGLTVSDLLDDDEWQDGKINLQQEVNDVVKSSFVNDVEAENGINFKYEAKLEEPISEELIAEQTHALEAEDEILNNSAEESEFKKLEIDYHKDDLAEEKEEDSYPLELNSLIEDATDTSQLNAEILSHLLADDEPEIEVKEEIKIEPPSSAKNLLITEKDDIEIFVRNNWEIEDEALKGIVNAELHEFDHEKIANDNSKVLNDLLKEDVVQKVEPFKIDVEDKQHEEELEKDDQHDEYDGDEYLDEELSTEKIEWNWGDELKEEFGIGQEYSIVEVAPENIMSTIVEETKPVEIDEIEFDLERTRQDLFERLEKTLEREVTSLRENFIPVEEKLKQVEILRDLKETVLSDEALKATVDSIDNKNETMYKVETEYENEIEEKPLVEFKDEKVVLDLKTPPPSYDFIEEPEIPKVVIPPAPIFNPLPFKEDHLEEPPSFFERKEYLNEPILSKPKRMTILLEKEKEEEKKQFEKEKEELKYEIPDFDEPKFDELIIDEQKHEEIKFEDETQDEKVEFDNLSQILSVVEENEKVEFEEEVDRKKVTIIDEPSDDFSAPEIETKPKKKYSKIIGIAAAAIVLVAAAVGYYFFASSSKENLQTSKQAAVENKTEVNNGNLQNVSPQFSREAIGLDPDDFNEFPTTATPPEPVKEGSSVDLTKILDKKPANNLPNNEELLRQSQKEESERRAKLEKSNKQQPAGETRLSNMVFYDGKNYNFQISSWKNKTLADSEVSRLRSLGFNAFLIEAFLPDKGGSWYRIRIGTFKTEQEALDFKKRNSF